ncbi:hypothetical protein DFJ73DRAFT_340806 [Zopfochytrium polystomum]|nr:hypothetical protein DFJ73DRAFT_340806 [Zopfochytrium polystomum]
MFMDRFVLMGSFLCLSLVVDGGCASVCEWSASFYSCRWLRSLAPALHRKRTRTPPDDLLIRNSRRCEERTCQTNIVKERQTASGIEAQVRRSACRMTI